MKILAKINITITAADDNDDDDDADDDDDNDDLQSHACNSIECYVGPLVDLLVGWSVTSILHCIFCYCEA